MTKLETYCDLREAASEAAQARKEHELEIFAALEAIDPELVNDGLDLVAGPNAREVLAHYLIRLLDIFRVTYNFHLTGKQRPHQHSAWG